MSSSVPGRSSGGTRRQLPLDAQGLMLLAAACVESDGWWNAEAAAGGDVARWLTREETASRA